MGQPEPRAGNGRDDDVGEAADAGGGAFVKNAGLGFGIPCLHNGQNHEYQPDFLVRLKDRPDELLIIETKGYDDLADVKKTVAERSFPLFGAVVGKIKCKM